MKQMFFELAVWGPGLGGRYCAVKLEMAVARTRAPLTEQLRSDDVPGQESAKYKLASDLTARLGIDVDVDEAPDLQFFWHVDDHYATFEWSEGGMIHAHMAFWIVGAPRIDKIDAPRLTTDTAFVEIDAAPPGAEVVAEAEAADRLAAFWDRAYTEFNVAKTVAHESFTQASAASRDVGVRQRLGPAEEKQVRSPESISYDTFAHCLLGGLELPTEAGDRCWGELVEILGGCSRIAVDALAAEFGGPGSASLEARRSRARLHFVAALAEWTNMHDLH